MQSVDKSNSWKKYPSYYIQEVILLNFKKIFANHDQHYYESIVCKQKLKFSSYNPKSNPKNNPIQSNLIFQELFNVHQGNVALTHTKEIAAQIKY